MAAYLTVSAFKLASTCPPELIDQLETRQPGWVDRQLSLKSAWLDARLSKRYQAPFADPAPYAVVDWLAAIVTLKCYLRRGVDPTDAQFQIIKEQAEQAEREVTEAALSETGLFELPLRQDTTQGGIAKGGVLFHTETSPYAWRDAQRQRGREEDNQC